VEAVPKRLFTNEQATAQVIPEDFAWYTGYADTVDRIMHQSRVTPINKFYQGAVAAKVGNSGGFDSSCPVKLKTFGFKTTKTTPAS
jgi:hypothetical protein